MFHFKLFLFAVKCSIELLWTEKWRLQQRFIVFTNIPIQELRTLKSHQVLSWVDSQVFSCWPRMVGILYMSHQLILPNSPLYQLPLHCLYQNILNIGPTFVGPILKGKTPSSLLKACTAKDFDNFSRRKFLNWLQSKSSGNKIAAVSKQCYGGWPP